MEPVRVFQLQLVLTPIEKQDGIIEERFIWETPLAKISYLRPGGYERLVSDPCVAIGIGDSFDQLVRKYRVGRVNQN